jgi:hypothetical protein
MAGSNDHAGVNRRSVLLGGSSLAAAGSLIAGAQAQQSQPQASANSGKPNIVVIFGDDIGI